MSHDIRNPNGIPGDGNVHGATIQAAVNLLDGTKSFRKRRKESRVAAFGHAKQFMPFDTQTKRPFCIGSTHSISEAEAEIIFDAFDNERDMRLDRLRVRHVLLALEIEADVVEACLNQMFYGKGDQEQLSWDHFRLWLKRGQMLTRSMNSAEKIFYTLDDPSSSQFASIVSTFMVLLIFGSVVAFLCESLPVSSM